jgi:hypothetical protein
MSEATGFTTMAAGATGGEAPEISVGMLGYAFMGKAHTKLTVSSKRMSIR